ncbi:hypothetical protein [Rhizobium laguerreae]|uniref:hypothetical protein n=1 Tax=Rhizobium laguerreae TaxID=1076926 RepID=UPI001C92096F|nr:hypothetical protein [Rhizobium laguerreae]MBY3212155.1 hypothetical protein [Rhizobium laguerreae]
MSSSAGSETLKTILDTLDAYNQKAHIAGGIVLGKPFGAARLKTVRAVNFNRVRQPDRHSLAFTRNRTQTTHNFEAVPVANFGAQRYVDMEERLPLRKLWSEPMILSATAEKLKRQSMDDFKAGIFQSMADRAGVALYLG